MECVSNETTDINWFYSATSYICIGLLLMVLQTYIDFSTNSKKTLFFSCLKNERKILLYCIYSIFVGFILYSVFYCIWLSE